MRRVKACLLGLVFGWGNMVLGGCALCEAKQAPIAAKTAPKQEKQKQKPPRYLARKSSYGVSRRIAKRNGKHMSKQSIMLAANTEFLAPLA